ncbi:hypothetical protein [Mycolicibacter arupensis]|uniref:Uncharacterized protein n=1 Tax=Mycolicibacter arupensis TaxID=342002 RepID=A0A5C7Y2Y7_9MYCO|nr:hypothetical protein [Mycolicibacter arupensis]TXI55942.1 MAG: hypothetical protein E6Q54_11995 [Mycolicibacter arupensis]
MTEQRITSRTRGLWKVTDDNGRVSVWDMDNRTWEGSAGGPWRITRTISYPRVGAIFQVEVDDPSREWTMPPLVLGSSNVVSIEPTEPHRIAVLALDGDVMETLPTPIAPSQRLYDVSCRGVAVATTFTTADGEVVRFYSNPDASVLNLAATRLWAALNPAVSQQLMGTVFVTGVDGDGADADVPASVAQAAMRLPDG